MLRVLAVIYFLSLRNVISRNKVNKCPTMHMFQQKFFLIQATDLDEGENSQIQFSLNPSTYSTNFTIDPTSGDITPTADLDYERLNSSYGGLIELVVIATDKGNPALSSNVTLSIQVQVSKTPKDIAHIYMSVCKYSMGIPGESCSEQPRCA